MMLHDSEKEKAIAYLKNATGKDDLACPFCDVAMMLKFVPFYIETVQKGSALSNEAILMRMVSLQCTNCGNLQFFKGSIAEKEIS